MLGSLDTLERYNLVDDAWNEVVAGRLTAVDYLTFVEGFGGERELAVWQAIVLGLRGLGRLVDDDHYPTFQARVRALLAPVVAELGEPVAGEDDLRASCAACSPPPWRSRATTRPPRPAAPSCTTAARPSPARSIPSWWRQRPSSSRPPGDDAVYERLLVAVPHARRPRRTSSATSTRSPSSTPRR